MRFRDLIIGTVFEFDHNDLHRYSGFKRGPWIKTSTRKYILQHDHNFKCQVGTIDVKVITQ